MFEPIFEDFENLDVSLMVLKDIRSAKNTPYRCYEITGSDSQIMTSDKSVWITSIRNNMVLEHLEMSIDGALKNFKYAWSGEWISTVESYWVPGGCTEEEFFQYCTVHELSISLYKLLAVQKYYRENYDSISNNINKITLVRLSCEEE